MKLLIVHLESPLMAFGGETIDNYGVIRWFPAASMLTGLFANALGWRRVEREKHQRLQERLTFAARIDREPAGRDRLRDYQTALLYENDEGWTTRGYPDGRKKSPSYKPIAPDNRKALTWQRYRDYFADMRVSVALALAPEDEAPTLDDLAQALQEPARPLFIGRKPCLPSAPLFGGMIEADTRLDALFAAPLERDPGGDPVHDAVRMQWPADERREGVAPRDVMLTDERNWISGLHGGGRRASEGSAPRDRFAKRASAGEEDVA